MSTKPHLPLLVATLLVAGACASGPHAPARSANLAAGHSQIDLRLRTQHLEQMRSVLRGADVQDAKRQAFHHRFWARADVRSLAMLRQAQEASSSEEMVRLASDFLQEARRDGESSFEMELTRLPRGEAVDLARSFGCPPGDARSCLLAMYRNDAKALLESDLDTLRRLDGRPAIAAWIKELGASVEPSVKNRGRLFRKLLTFPAFPAVYAWRKSHSAHEYEGPQWIDFPQYRLYMPSVEGASGEDEALLAHFAPALVQEIDPEAAYAPEIDRFGALVLASGNKGPLPEVIPEQPVSYSYVDTVPLRGKNHKQLVYTFWYPEHPRFKKFLDVERGHIEGITLRITLDQNERPRLYETIYNCGCSHRVFVDREIEEEAKAEYGAPEGDRPYSVQRDQGKGIDWIVPELVDFDPAKRLTFYVRAGFHMPASVRYVDLDSLQPAEVAAYDLRDYSDLELTPYRDGWNSIFTSSGLVRGAFRLEGALLTPLGIYRAGQPRQRGTQLIHFDQADFDDPDLFDTYLRLPQTF